MELRPPRGTLDLLPPQGSRIRALYDERFIRMWDMYLAGCEMVFRSGQAMVFQIQLARSPATVPMTRSYIDEFERVHEARRRT